MGDTITSRFEGMAIELQSVEKRTPVTSGAAAGIRMSRESRNAEVNRITTDAVQTIETTIDKLVAGFVSPTSAASLRKTLGRISAEAYVLGKDTRGAVESGVKYVVPTDAVPMSRGAMGAETRQFASENYDNSPLRGAPELNAAYNLAAPVQSDAAELLFPTYAITPDQPGYTINISRTVLQRKLARSISGQVSDWGNINLLRAYRRPKLLQNDNLKVKPIWREESKASFVDVADAAPTDDEIADEAIKTSFLKCGVKVDLLALSQTQSMVARGLMNETDVLDRFAQLEKLLIKVGNDRVVLPVANFAGSQFTYAPQGDSRDMVLSFDVGNCPFTAKVKRQDASPLVTLKAVVDNNWTVQLNVAVSGRTNLRETTTVVRHGDLSVAAIIDESGSPVSLLAGAGKTLVDLFAGGEIIGYAVKTNRANLNLRVHGQLIDFREHKEFHGVGLKSPLTARRATSADNSNTFADVARLVEATHVAIEASAMNLVRETAEYLETYVTNPDPLGVGPDLLGSGRFYVIPRFVKHVLDVAKEVQVMNSSEKRSAIKGLLVAYLTEMATQLYVNGEYKSTLMGLYGPAHQKPVFAVLTTPRIASYLQIDGDLRTLGPEIECRVVTTIMEDFGSSDGSWEDLYMVPVIVGDERNNGPLVANFGTFAVAPEIVSSITIPRDGQTSVELTVTPRFEHYVNCPLMAHIRIESILDALGRTGLNVDVTSMPPATP